jgi:capsular polysaccharide transport system permease protein
MIGYQILQDWRSRALEWTTQVAIKEYALRHKLISFAAVLFLLFATYWLFLASDRYVSTAHIVVQRTDLSGGGGVDFASLLSGSGGGINRQDQLMLRDYLLSVDLLQKIDADLHLRSHFSNWNRDPISKLWYENAPIEWFHDYYLSRVSIEIDDFTGLLVINAQAFSPDMAYNIGQVLVREGDIFMNKTANGLALIQVEFLEKQVAQMHAKFLVARQALLSYQNQKGLLAPMAAAESIVAIVAKLQANLSELQTQRSALQAYLVPTHPSVVQLNQQIEAVEKQIGQEQRNLASPSGQPLNKIVEEYQRLEQEAGFAEAIYKTALSGLESGRIEATRTIKKITITQAPNLPEYPREPRRIHNTLVAFISLLILLGIFQLLLAVVQDHKD